MISPETGVILKEAIQNEFHVTVDIYSKDGLLMSDPSGIPMADNRFHAEKDARLFAFCGDTEDEGYIKCREDLSEEEQKAVRMFVHALVSYKHRGNRMNQIAQKESVLVTRMLSPEASVYRNDILAFGATLGYKLEHPMAMVVASLETNYNYCLNMNLGYESASSDAKDSILTLLKEHMYMNRQDIVAFVQNNCLVLLKAIEELNDVPKLYRMTDRVAEMVSDALKSYRIFRYYVAPGEIIKSFDHAYRAYQEALEYISFAQKMDLEHPVITHDDVLYYALSARLPDKLRVEIMEPKVQALLSQNRELIEGLIQCFDAYIDNGFNIASTADAVYLHRNTVKKRMDKLHKLTGFDPLGDFKNVLMNKLILQEYLVESREQ